MSSSTEEDIKKKSKDLEQSQNDQNNVGSAESNPETSGPTDNVRDQALKVTDNKNDEEEPA